MLRSIGQHYKRQLPTFKMFKNDDNAIRTTNYVIAIHTNPPIDNICTSPRLSLLNHSTTYLLLQ